MVVIKGRGIQRIRPDSPADDIRSYDATEDLELCDKDSAHLPVRVPPDDLDPFCMVGGGHLNLAAGCVLIREYEPRIVVCAYGGRSDYLVSVQGPSESEVMSEILAGQLKACAGVLPFTTPGYFPEIVVWPRERTLDVPSNSRQELKNAFELALERGAERLAIVTVGVHYPRTATYVAKHLSVYRQYRALSPVVLESEEVLLHANRHRWNERVEALRNSRSFARNWEREAVGISKIVRDVYGDAKPPVDAK